MEERRRKKEEGKVGMVKLSVGQPFLEAKSLESGSRSVIPLE